MTKKYILSILFSILIPGIISAQNREYEKFYKALIKGDTILAKQIEDRNITTELIEEKPFPERNIPEHIFKLSISQIKDSIIAFFDFANQYPNKILNSTFYYYFPLNNSSEKNRHDIFFITETANEELFGKSYFSNPNTSNDIYLHNFDEPWLSKLYSSKGKQLEYRTAFIIKLSTQDSNSTKVTIVAESPRVLNGVTGFGVHAPIARETKVQSSSIEEYSLLLFIADELGENNMTPLKLPSGR